MLYNNSRDGGFLVYIVAYHIFMCHRAAFYRASLPPLREAHYS